MKCAKVSSKFWWKINKESNKSNAFLGLNFSSEIRMKNYKYKYKKAIIKNL